MVSLSKWFKLKYCNVADMLITHALGVLVCENIFATRIDLFNGEFHFDPYTKWLVVVPRVSCIVISTNRQINQKEVDIYMTVFDFDEIRLVGLWIRVYTSHQMLGQSDIQVQR